MEQSVWMDYLKLLGRLSGTVAQLTDIERKKNEAAARGDVDGVDECMKQEQVMSLSLRGIEQKRTALADRLGLRGVPLRELAAHSPEGLAVETRKAADELRGQYEMFKAASDAARNTLEVNLRAIELYCAERDKEPPKEMETRRQTDFRA